ncbi:acetylxylan esterase [candidate division KSB1 bacterium]|nr:acetylxylan esterase [candidate division KSB1 bacterium]RQW03356.1 MAG: acetylxylan esterase [candidate division KSB1 bacterium]
MSGKATFFIFLCIISFVLAQPEGINYDEAKVPVFELPDPLVMLDGPKVQDSQTWIDKRRPEILSLFEEFVYGKAPEKKIKITFEIVESDPLTLNGLATRKQVRVYLIGKKEGPFMDVLIYLPNKVEKPAPLFVGLNFYGNQTVIDDPAVLITKSWVRNSDQYGITDHQATQATRGVSARRWPIKTILESGYGLATIYYGDIDPDDEGKFDNGIHPYFYQEGQTQPAPDEWGAIAAWAWGLSRAMDYFEKDEDIAHEQVIVLGHSRLGKTALWAGAVDERFAIVISNNSGCGGAALSRRAFGETVKRINTSFPHWFCDNFNQYNDNENACPVDQHMLIALMAPRPVYVASAEEDLWADPRGEFLSTKYASPVYELFGLQGMPAQEMPDVSQPAFGTIGYHVRPGKHDVTDYDWDQYIKFANKHLSHTK